MINRGAEEALFSLSNKRKWPAIAFWARVNRVKAITHVQDRLVTRLPISSPLCLAAANPFLFFKSSVVISSSSLTTLFLSFFLSSSPLDKRILESRWISPRPTVNLGVEIEHRNVETPRWIIYEASVTRWAENRGRRSGGRVYYSPSFRACCSRNRWWIRLNIENDSSQIYNSLIKS